MFGYDNKCLGIITKFLNDFNLNIKNRNDCFIIQCSSEQITDENQNAAEKFKSFTKNQSRLQQDNAAFVWREKWPIHQFFISKQKKMIWTKKLTQKCQNKLMLIKICELWINHTRKWKMIKNKFWEFISIIKRSSCMKFINDWITHWMIYQNQLTYLTSIQAEDLKKLKMKWHIILIITKNNLITQMSIEKIELVKFLHIHTILKFDYSNCFCGVNKQMLKHVMMNYFLMSKKNKIRRAMNGAAKNYHRSMIIFKTAKALTSSSKWTCFRCFRWPKISCIEAIW